MHLKPEQLQLGFLKVLKGSLCRSIRKSTALSIKAHPPYEVLYTKWISYEDVLRLKGIEEMVEVYYNSRQFTNTMEELERNTILHSPCMTGLHLITKTMVITPFNTSGVPDMRYC